MNTFPSFVSNRKLFSLVYLIINSIFVLKYSERIEMLPSYFLLLIYIGFIISVFYLHKKVEIFLNKIKKMKFYLLIFSLVFFILLMFINLKIDGESLNVDRWSALEVLISSILEGKYPYAVLDHLGNTTSNLPGLFYIGLPFYLLGDLGFLQPFTFLFFSIFIIFSKIKNSQKVFIFLLIICAPSYFWEVVVKSDLMSNCLLLLVFISIWQQKFKNNLFKNKGLLALITALFVLTRGIVAIPLTIFLFSSFLKISLRNKVLFFCFFAVFLILISLPVFIDLPSLEFIRENNPFNHQTRYAPKGLIITSLILPFLISYKVRKSSDVFLFSTYILASLMFLTFFINCVEESFYDNIYGNLFDISYLSMILPFIWMFFLENFKNQNGNSVEIVK